MGIIRPMATNGPSYPTLPLRFLWPEILLGSRAATIVVAAKPDLAEPIETPVGRPLAHVAFRYRGATHDSFTNTLAGNCTLKAPDWDSATHTRASLGDSRLMAFESTSNRQSGK